MRVSCIESFRSALNFGTFRSLIFVGATVVVSVVSVSSRSLVLRFFVGLIMFADGSPVIETVDMVSVASV